MARRFAGEDAPLFRDEALSRLRGSAWQPVLLSKPVSSYVLTAFSLTAAAALLGFAANFEFARKTQVQGYLVPATGWSRVTVNSYGVVSQRLVNPGDTVQMGDVLLEIASGDGLGRALTVQDHMLGEIRERRDTLALREDLIAREYEQERALLTHQNESDRRELDRLNEEIQLAETRLLLARQQYRDSERLAGSGALSQADVIRLEEEVHSRLLFLSERRRIADRLRSKLSAADARFTHLVVNRDLDQAVIRDQIHALKMEESRIRSEGTSRVLAPREGTVASVRVEVGDALHPLQTLLDIVPSDSVLLGRLFVPSAAMGFIEPGQEVRVYLDAFPYERYGAQAARVLSISETTAAPTDTEISQLPVGGIYRVDVAFPEGFGLPPGQQHALRPGMTLTADLVRDYGTLVDWILEPLRGTARRL